MPPRSRTNAFTLVELLAVVTIILVLTGLILGTFKFVQDKGARSRAEAEIKGMEAALESYKADNGDYAKGTESGKLKPTTSFAPSAYVAAGKELYIALTGDADGDFTNGIALAAGAKTYFEFKPNQLSTTSPSYPIDPWGSAYGYSTIMATTNADGYNPTFDLWSTGGSSSDQVKWIKNW